MDTEHPECLLFLKCAQQHSLRYMCIGGYAVNYYGYHRSTEDMYSWIVLTNEKKLALFDTLISLVPYSYLRDMKLRSTCPRDLWDLAKWDETITKK